MNRIQKMSQDLVCQRLKLQMGLDPQLDIEPKQLQAMWAQLQKEQRLARQADREEPQLYPIDRAA